MIKFVYRDKEYSWDKWHEVHKEFIDRLELPDDLLIDWSLRDNSVLHDIGYSIAMDKYRDLYKLIASARASLINSFDKFYESNIIKWDSPYEAHLWMRGEYLKNSIIWYNSCEDYIYQAIWFAFDMGEADIKSSKDYQNQLRNASYKSVKSKLENKNSKECKELLSYINNYRFEKNVKNMRDNLANKLKHRANLSFKGLEDSRVTSFSTLDENNNVKFDAKWIEEENIDIDKTIEEMEKIHIKLIDFARKIKDFIGFENMFELDENGNIILNNIKDKKEYKKILF